MKIKNPETSNEAFHSLDQHKLQDTHKKILFALTNIVEGTSEEIAAHLKESHAVIWKRMNEIHKKGLIYRPGNKRMLKSGRNGFTWMLTEPPKTDEEKKRLQIYLMTLQEFWDQHQEEQPESIPEKKSKFRQGIMF